MTDVLARYRVVDLGRGRAASHAGLLLAQGGATVTKVADASAPSLLNGVQAALWDRCKTTAPMDLSTAEGRAALDALLAEADVVVHDRVPSEAAALGLDPQALSARFPRLVHVAITGWPAGHAKENAPVSDALVMAEGGFFDEQAAVSRDGPVWLRFELGSNHASYLGAAGAVARLFARMKTGKGGAFQTSLFQGAEVPILMHWHDAETPTAPLKFGMPKNSGATVFLCSDGLWIHTMNPLHIKSPTISAAFEAMGPEEVARHDAKYANDIIKYIPHRGACEYVIGTHTREYWLKEFWACDCAAQPVLPMGELYNDEQAQANGYVIEVDDPKFGRTRQPGSPVQMTPTGQGSAPAAAPPARLRYPLEGVKVLDIGNFLAGPLVPMLLGDLGAEVIKVEPVSEDPLRFAHWAFNGCQRNKRDIALQLKDPAAADVVKRLAGWADIVHHNQRMPAAERLGLGVEAIHDINPNAIYSHVSSYGPKGPRKDWPGFDQLFQASGGWEYEGAGEGNPPMWHRFGMMDHLGALASLYGTLLALLRREETGETNFVGVGLLGAVLASTETLQLPNGEMAPYARLDKDQMGLGPTRRMYVCADGWVAVDGPEGSALPPSLASDPEGVLAGKTVKEAIALFEAGGLPAAPVTLNYGPAFLADKANQALGLVAAYPHPVYGRYAQPGALWSLGDMEVRLDRPPPVLGQHSREILQEQGFTAAEIDALVSGGVVLAA